MSTPTTIFLYFFNSLFAFDRNSLEHVCGTIILQNTDLLYLVLLIFRSLIQHFSVLEVEKRPICLHGVQSIGFHYQMGSYKKLQASKG